MKPRSNNNPTDIFQMKTSGTSFLEELAKAQPNPGGGAAAAYGATLALALLTKVIRLEHKRSENRQVARFFWEERLRQVRKLHEEMEHLREADVQAYMNLARALRHGRQELPSALEKAIGYPRRIMEGAFGGLKEVAAAGDKCRKHLIPDLQVAAEFLRAALAGAYQIAVANLPLLPSPESRQDQTDRLDGLLRRGNLAWRGVRRLLTARTLSSD
jgi:formiminotetrahydrofolate cyclodeaminase|uniref:Cyclodeaminase/cyclohydrolase domain-containing protein n=1 Tax=Desulfobacca acetoxidans TaxID=60893 RepID=A0A7C3SJY6_9BACT